MDESWEKWLSDLEMDECHLFSESDMNSLEEELKGENPPQPALSWESQSSDSNFTTEGSSVLTVTAAAAATSNTMGNSSLKEITGFDNGSLKQHASSEKPLFSSSMSYILSFEDSIAVPNIPKKTCQNHGAQSKETQEEPGNRKSKRSRTSQIQDHIMAERKRRENLTRMFIALSATIPGLKKMDKASVLNEAIDYVKHLQKRVIELEEQNRKRKIQTVVYFCNKSNVAVADDFSCTSDRFDRPIKTFPNVEASVSAKDVLIRVMCEKQKDMVPKLLAKLEANNLSIVCSSVLPFGNSTLNITIIAQMDHEFSLTMDDLVKKLNEDLSECCNAQQ